MKPNEMIQRYVELYDEMATAKDPQKMQTFGKAEAWAFNRLAEVHPELAARWLDKLEAGNWNNWISQEEWEELSRKLVNQDGSRGPHWTFNQVMPAVSELGGTAEEKPYYNSYALALVMNMLWSDHSDSVTTYVEPANHIAFFFSQAVEKLKDADRPRFVREYFDI